MVGYIRIKLNGIVSPNSFRVSYKTGSTPYPLNSGYTYHGGTYSGGTTDVDIDLLIDELSGYPFNNEYWVKIEDTVHTKNYLIKNIVVDDVLKYESVMNEKPTATVNSTNVLCNGGSNGTITVTNPVGGYASPYYVRLVPDEPTYVLFDTGKTFTSLSAGTHTVYVKDSTDTESNPMPVVMTEPAVLTASIYNVTPASSYIINNGTFSITSTGGTWPKTYVLYKDESFPYETCGGTTIVTYANVVSGSPIRNITGLQFGWYCLEVTDNNGCITNSGLVEVPVV